METQSIPPKRQKHRSPSYPAFDLETTLGRAQQLFKIAGKHGVPVPAALEAWDFTAKSSNGSLTIAALKRFDLANDEGQRGARSVVLTPLGHELVVYSSQRDSDEWKTRVRKAALSPSIHAALWAKYNGDLPADSVIRPHLVIDLGFSDSAARDLLREFRSTIDFAGLTSADGVATLSDKKDESQAESSKSLLESVMSPPTITPTKPEQDTAPPVNDGVAVAQQRTIQVPYSPAGWALLQAQFPMSEVEWKQMLAVLEAMKPSLVVSDDE